MRILKSLTLGRHSLGAVCTVLVMGFEAAAQTNEPAVPSDLAPPELALATSQPLQPVSLLEEPLPGTEPAVVAEDEEEAISLEPPVGPGREALAQALPLTMIRRMRLPRNMNFRLRCSLLWLKPRE